MPSLLEGIEKARVFDLEQLRYAGAPSHPAHAPGFNYFLHRHHARGAPEPRTGASGIIVTPEHSGNHIEALTILGGDFGLSDGSFKSTGDGMFRRTEYSDTQLDVTKIGGAGDVGDPRPLGSSGIGW